MTQENHWWLCVQYSSADPMRVERFETEEQAELHAAITGGCVIGPYDRDDLNSRHILMRLHVLAPHTTNNTIYHDILYDYCMAFSERTE